MQGGQLENIIAAKAVAFEEASRPELRAYAEAVIKNTQILAASLNEKGFRIVSGGTDNHLLNIDFGSEGLTGKEAERRLEEINIVVNREVVPRDSRKPYIASCIRLGTAALTTRKMGETEMRTIAELVTKALDPKIDQEELLSEVTQLSYKFLLPD